MPQDLRMSMTLEDRVAALEREMAEFRKLSLHGVDVLPKDEWMKTFGWAKADRHFEEALRLGAEWRARENADKGNAGS